ncbi:MAG: tetratricopeptide repeat protein, partial [Mucilaginibacter sp.]
MKLKLFVFFTILLVFQLSGYSQVLKQRKIDSMLILLSKSKPDTNRIKILLWLSSSLYFFDTDKGLMYSDQAIRLSTKLNWKKGLVNAYYCSGLNYLNKNDFINGLAAFGKSLTAAREAGPKENMVNILLNIGVCYYYEGNQAQYMAYIKAAVSLAKQSPNRQLLLNANGFLAGAYAENKQFKLALSTYRSALSEYVKLKDTARMALFSVNVAETYFDLKDFGNAMVYRKAALKLYKKLGDKEGILKSIAGIGDIYTARKDFTRAIYRYRRALSLIEANEDKVNKRLIADYYFEVANLYLSLDSAATKAVYTNNHHIGPHLSAALQDLKKSLAISQSDQYQKGVLRGLKKLYEIQEAKQEYNAALKTFKKYIQIRDTATGIEKQKEYIRHQSQFEFNKRKDSLNYIVRLKDLKMTAAKSAVEAKLRQRTIYAVLVLAALLFIASYFVYKNRLQKLRFSNQIAKDKLDNQLKEI